MNATIPITKAQAQLPKLVRSGQTFTLLRHGQPVCILLPVERMEAILETMELLANPAAMKAIRDYQAGRGKPIALAKFEKELDAQDAKAR